MNQCTVVMWHWQNYQSTSFNLCWGGGTLILAIALPELWASRRMTRSCKGRWTARHSISSSNAVRDLHVWAFHWWPGDM